MGTRLTTRLTAAVCCTGVLLHAPVQLTPPAPAWASRPATTANRAPDTAAQGMPANLFVHDRGWWRHAVFYEIYPRSFADRNNDGTGDLNGITAHLDHLAALGVDAIWITPCFPSPQVDFGYDVSDYRNIDPQYGTLVDFDRLVREARRRGIKVILDFVVNHTSDQHPWFRQSRSSRTNPYRDYYVWRDGRKPGEPPNNWTSIFGGPGWTWDETTGQWYHHYFYPQQPDLNWRNPVVEREMFDIARFWFRRGVYGFRLDAVDILFEDPAFRDNPPAEGTDAYGQPAQRHVMDRDLPEVHTELQKLRKVADEFPGRVLVGETYTDSPEQLAAYYGPARNELQMPMYFNFTEVDRLDAAAFREKIDAIEHNRAGGWPVYVLGNHDIRRVVERYGSGENKDAVAKLMAALQLTLRGTAILYYGDEIGMQNHDPTRVEDVKDVIGKLGWPKQKGRDGERTPMQWDASANAGFDAGARPWLPVNPDYVRRNVAAESADPGSVLNWYRAIIRLRRENPALYEGSYVPLNEHDAHLLAFVRQSRDRKVVVVLNMSGAEQVASFDGALGGAAGKVLATTRSRPAARVRFEHVRVEPYGVVIAEVDRASR